MDGSLLWLIFWAMLELKYAGIIVLMFLDNTILPIPGETFLLFAGYLISIGQMDFWLVVLACSAGALLGASLGYWIGHKYGESFVERYGKFVLLSKSHLRLANSWFAKRGSLTVFYSRFVPGVGYLMCIPAGIAKMNRWLFLLMTFLSSLLWYTGVVYVCKLFARQWERFDAVMQPLQLILLLALALVIILFVVKKVRGNVSSAKN
jgi:membrane protein DedA with SNARE-associated domain